MVLLSVCIPTYNRAPLLRETLDSILLQQTEEVEITVSDNGSIDDTQALVAEYQARFPRIRYFRFAQNQGPDKCYLNSIEIATGKYCWLMGSDDWIEEGGIAHVLLALKTKEELTGISVRLSSYDAQMGSRVRTESYGFLPEEDRMLLTNSDFFPQFAIYTGYMSAQIVNRRLWQEVVSSYPVERFFNAYSLVYIMLNMFTKHPHWMYLSQRCVRYRTGNDSFLDKGLFNRIKIDILGFQQILGALFASDSSEYQNTIDFLGRKFISWWLFSGNVRPVEKGFWRKTFSLCFRVYGRKTLFWSHLLPFFLFPSFFWKFTRWIYRRVSKGLLMDLGFVDFFDYFGRKWTQKNRKIDKTQIH